MTWRQDCKFKKIWFMIRGGLRCNYNRQSRNMGIKDVGNIKEVAFTKPAGSDGIRNRTSQ